MSSRYQPAIEAFLAAHQPAIAALTQQAYTATGGHYARLLPADRTRQATSDAWEFAVALAGGQVDLAGIARVLAPGVDLAVIQDIVRMTTVQEQLFVAFVEQTLPQEPELARELVYRTHHSAARFRLALNRASMNQAVQRPAPPELAPCQGAAPARR
jgi:hypothetical protein